MKRFVLVLDHFFLISQHGSTVGRECLAGLTTFIAMAYIIFVHPNIMALAGMPHEGAMAATIYISALVTLVMGLWANIPVAVAPGMGVNLFFTNVICLEMGFSWQKALGLVCISGLIFLLLTVSRLGQQVVRNIPLSLKHAIAVGVGFFIAFIGLKTSGIVVPHAGNMVALGDMGDPKALLSLFGIALIAVLLAKRVQGALLLGVLLITLLGMVLRLVPVPHGLDGFFSLDIPSASSVFLQLELPSFTTLAFVPLVVSLTMSAFLDNMGTHIGLASKSGRIAPDATVEALDKALVVNAGGVVLSSLIGSSGATTFIEGAAGIAEGGRTGLTALVVSACFFLSLVFWPFLSLVPSLATAPVLVVMGTLMLQEAKHIDFSNFAEVFPAFMTISMMALTFSIATGFCFGFISHVVIKSAVGQADEITFPMWLIFICFALGFAFS